MNTRLVGIASLVLALLAAPAAVVAEEPLLDPYGFIRLDLIFDDSRMQHPQFAFWVLSEDPLVGPANQSGFVIHPRVTRLGVRINPKPLSETTTLRGRVEIDFQNGGSESRETPRMRLAFFEIAHGNWRFLGGQDWDIVSPLYPTCHTDGILWNAGNLGDRRPQATAVYAPTRGDTEFKAEFALAQGGAIDAQNLDRNARLDAVDSATPQVQGRAGISRPQWGGTFLLGGWGHYTRTRTEMDVAGSTRFESYSAGIDAQVPLGSRVSFKGEAWVGKNLSDVRGGIGQGVNSLTGVEIESKGGWAELGFKVSDPLSLYAGGSIDDPKDEQLSSADDLDAEGMDLSGTGRTLNQVVYLSSRWKPWAPFLVGLEYFYWATEYKGLEKGTNNRVNLHFSFVF